MSAVKAFSDIEEVDSIDSYFECIASCSIGEDGMECIHQCVEVHLKQELN